MSNQSLEADIKSISAQWQNYRDFCKTKSKTGAVVRSVNKNHEVYDLVTNQLREKIEKTINSKPNNKDHNCKIKKCFGNVAILNIH